MGFCVSDDLRCEIYARCKGTGESISDDIRRLIAAVLQPLNPEFADVVLLLSAIYEAAIHGFWGGADEVAPRSNRKRGPDLPTRSDSKC